MPMRDRAARGAEEGGHRAVGRAREAATSPWAAFAHFGYAAKGIVYVLLALLVGKAALGVRGGSITDTKGALTAIYSEPFGRVLLAIVGVGLLGYALFNLALAALNLDHQRDDAKGIATRIGYGALGVAYVGLALAAFGLVAHGSGGKTSDQQAQDWTARLLALPLGVALVVLAALDRGDSGVYDVVDDIPLRRAEIAGVFAATVGRKRLRPLPGWLMRLAGGPSAEALSCSQRVSNRRFKAETGWAPSVADARAGMPLLVRPAAAPAHETPTSATPLHA